MEYNKKTGKWESPYWHPALTTDAVVFGFDKEDGSLQVLLIKRGKAKPGAIGHYPVVLSKKTSLLTNVSIENYLKNHQ